MNIAISPDTFAIFLTVLIAMLTLIGKQWHSDRKIFRILEAMDERQNTFQQTLTTIQDFIIENSKEHAILMERIERSRD